MIVRTRLATEVGRAALAGLLVACCAASARAQAPLPLHERIDALIESSQVGPLAPLVGDGELMRRLYLDLAGTLPTAEEARTFIDDPSSEKRRALIERLLAAPEFARRMQYAFDQMWMERRPDKQVPAPEWQEYLRVSFEQNKPYDQLAREILGADGVDDALRPTAKFYLDRDGEANALTRDVGRMFFGMDLQCAQCHDHPLIDSYHQSHYYGIMAFLNRGFLFTDANKKVFYAEKADGEVSFKSVFTGEGQENARPQLPAGALVEEPTFEAGQEYVVAPADGVRPVPKYSRRAELARLATSGENRAFNRNIANRLWALMMGRGLVHPVDLHHADNPPSHPELLELLADEFVAMKFDVRAFLAELAQSRAYQRASSLTAVAMPPVESIQSQLAAREAEVSRLAAAGEQAKALVESTSAETAAAREPVQMGNEALEQARQAEAQAKEAADAAGRALAQAKADEAAKQKTAALLADAADKARTAADTLPDDQELAQAAQQIETRRSEWQSMVEAATAAAAEQEAAAKAAAETLAATQQAAQQVAAELTAAQEHLRAVQSRLQQAEQALASGRSASQLASDRLADARLLAECAPLNSAWQAAQTAADAAMAELASLQGQSAEAATLSQQAEQAAADAQAASESAAAALATVQSQAQAKTEAAQKVAEAAASSQQAADQVPGDEPLAQAAAKFKSRSEQLAAELAVINQQVTELGAAATDAATRAAEAKTSLDAAQAQLAAARQAEQAAQQKATSAAEAAIAASTDAGAKLDLLTDRFSEVFLTGSLEPLSPEQLAWATMQATGVLAATRTAAEAELAQQNQPDPSLPPDQQAVQRAKLVEKSVHDKLKGNVDAFVSVFGQAPGSAAQGFQATVHEALFLANGGLVASWIAPSGSNLAGRLVAIEDPAALAEELYLAIFTRRPTADESAAVAAYLAESGSDRGTVVPELIWAMLSSNEFRFNH